MSWREERWAKWNDEVKKRCKARDFDPNRSAANLDAHEADIEEARTERAKYNPLPGFR